MKNKVPYIKLGIIFVLISVAMYFLHYELFHDTHHIFIYLLGDIAFLPIEVFLVSVVFHKVLDDKEKKTRLKKLNMIIGVFFTEAGTKLLGLLSDSDPEIEKIRKELVVRAKWKSADFKDVSTRISSHKYNLKATIKDIEEIKEYLISKRDILLKILENPNLIEHESFTNMLMSVFHITEELSERKNIKKLSDIDLEHILIDMKRAYKTLIFEWLLYMEHLHVEYPYLFSFAIRTNPFDKDAKVEIDL